MKTRILTGALFTGAILVFILPGFWSTLPPFVLLLVVLAVAWHEISQVLTGKFDQSPHHTFLAVGLVAGAIVITVAAYFVQQALTLGGEVEKSGYLTFLGYGPDVSMAGGRATIALLSALASGCLVLIVVSVCYALFSILGHGPAQIRTAVAMAAGASYVAFPLYVAIAMLFTVPRAIYWLVPALMAPWLTDVTAYFIGSWFGKHKIVPHISPKKTWEGSIGGLVGCMAAMVFWFVLIYPPAAKPPFGLMLGTGLGLGLAAGVVAQAGDWLASAVKRWAGIKDFGALFPGHGGVLDRFDSVLFTLPLFAAGAMISQLLWR